MFLHEVRMSYSRVETRIQLILELEEDHVQDRDRVMQLTKRNAEFIEKYIEHIESYLKARQDLKNINDKPTE